MLGPLTTTNRGFERIEFTDRCNARCSLQQSSLADSDRPGASAVWLGVGDHRMHLLREQVIDLIKHLQQWLDYNSFGPVAGWRGEHPEADVPEWFEQFADHSWRNDAMPIFHVSDTLAVFVDYADPEKSEFCEGRLDGSHKRYEVVAIADPNDPNTMNTYVDEAPLLETDDLEELKAFLEANAP